MIEGRIVIFLAALAGVAPLLLAGCDRPPDDPAAAMPAPDERIERALDARTEVLHQTREVIRYVEEEQRLNQLELRQRGLESVQ